MAKGFKTGTRIIFDARMVKARPHGIGRYARSLLEGLAKIDTVHQYLILTNNDGRYLHTVLEQPNFKNITITTPPFFPSEHVAIPHILRTKKADLFHSPSFLAPIVQPCPTVMTIHDTIPLLFPEGHSFMYPFYYEYSIKPAARRAERIITVSHHSKQDIVRLLDVKPDKVLVIPNAADGAYVPIQDEQVLARVRAKYHLPEQFIFYVGGSKSHKNVFRLLMAFQLLCEAKDMGKVELILSLSRSGDLVQVTEQLSVANRIKFLGNISERDLPAVYHLASLFVYPSLYEGFGLPPLEAMACGTPVVTSATSSLPEVVGNIHEPNGAGILVNPYKVEEMASAMGDVLRDQRLQQKMRERGLTRARQFAWEDVARRTLAVYEEVMKSS